MFTFSVEYTWHKLQDEDFVSRILSTKTSSRGASNGKSSVAAELGGDLYVMSKQRLRRFDGSFRDYKKLVIKKVLSNDDFTYI